MFSRDTNDLDYRAVVRFLFALLHACTISALSNANAEWFTRGVVAVDAANLELTCSVVVSDEVVRDDEQVYEIDIDYAGVGFHCADRADGEYKHPFSATVTKDHTHESPQLDHLRDDVDVFADLDSIIWAFDCEYTIYPRFCKIKHSDDDFVILLHSNARLDVLERNGRRHF